MDIGVLGKMRYRPIPNGAILVRLFSQCSQFQTIWNSSMVQFTAGQSSQSHAIWANLEQSNKSQLIIPDHFSPSTDKAGSMRLRLAQFLAELHRYKDRSEVPPWRLSPI